MSTRGFIAAKIDDDNWEGVYVHHDAYPLGLGAAVWDGLEEQGVDEFITSAITAHPGGWSSFPEKCYCCDSEMAARDGSIRVDSPYYRPDAPDGRLRRSTAAAMCEWGYLIDPGTMQLSILVHEITSKYRIRLLQKAWYRDPVCIMVPYVTISLYEEEEPDWEAIEYVWLRLAHTGLSQEELHRMMTLRPYNTDGAAEYIRRQGA